MNPLVLAELLDGLMPELAQKIRESRSKDSEQSLILQAAVLRMMKENAEANIEALKLMNTKLDVLLERRR